MYSSYGILLIMKLGNEKGSPTSEVPFPSPRLPDGAFFFPNLK